jgi:hypothetical protein
MLDTVGMELQGKLDSFVRVKAELLKRLQRVWSIDNTTPNRKRSTILDFHKVDLSLAWLRLVTSR